MINQIRNDLLVRQGRGDFQTFEGFIRAKIEIESKYPGYTITQRNSRIEIVDPMGKRIID